MIKTTWQHYKNTNCKVILLHCILKCDEKNSDNFQTSVSDIEKETGIQYQLVIDNLQFLREIKELEITGTKGNLLITVNQCKYAKPSEIIKNNQVWLELIQIKFASLPHDEVIESWSLKIEADKPDFNAWSSRQLFASLERFYGYWGKYDKEKTTKPKSRYEMMKQDNSDKPFVKF